MRRFRLSPFGPLVPLLFVFGVACIVASCIPSAAEPGEDGDGIGDGDGNEPALIDADGDGVPDSLGTTQDNDGDGFPDHIDLDGDGILDGIGVDTDGDGILDAVGIDTDGDGIIDGLDTTGDGTIDVRPPTTPKGSGGLSGDGDGVTPGDGDGDTIDPTSPGACGWTGPYAGADLGRCAEGKNRANGGYFTLDHFDDLNESIIASRDGRTGNWWSVAHASITATMSFAAPPTMGPSNSKGALHYTATAGSADAWAATLGVDIASCYDARAYEGLSFWFRGDPAAGQKYVKLSLHTPPTQPAESGGTCTSGCYDHYAVLLEATGAWKKYDLPWSAFKRLNCTTPTPGIPATFEPQSQIVGISFSQPEVNAGIDFWLDDVRFLRSSLTSSSTFAALVPEALFNEMFPASGRAAVFTYAGLIEAVTRCTNGTWPACSSFTTQGTLEDRLLEAAAFLAQVAHETGSLTLSEEAACKEGQCAYGNYYGRGALQLTHQVNYAAAGAAFGVNLSANPSLVASDPNLAWGTALWFWSTTQSGKGICHDGIVSQKSFGTTTSIINGIDCGGDKSASRILLFQTFAHALGVNPYTASLDCSG